MSNFGWKTVWDSQNSITLSTTGAVFMTCFPLPSDFPASVSAQLLIWETLVYRKVSFLDCPFPKAFKQLESRVTLLMNCIVTVWKAHMVRSCVFPGSLWLTLCPWFFGKQIHQPKHLHGEQTSQKNKVNISYKDLFWKNSMFLIDSIIM